MVARVCPSAAGRPSEMKPKPGACEEEEGEGKANECNQDCGADTPTAEGKKSAETTRGGF